MTSLSRREFNWLLGATGLIGRVPTSLASDPQRADNSREDSLDVLAESFATPPNGSRPHCYWMWMNGNVTREGITLDIEAMQRCGIGGFYLYQDAVGIPRGPVDYGSASWLDLMEHAMREAQRLGLTAAMHNSPGYSGTGGPWIPPVLSMQVLVWAESYVNGGGHVDFVLPQPHSRAGFYSDALVLAYPSLPVETGSLREALATATLSGIPLDKGRLQARDRAQRYRLERRQDGGVGSLDLQFDRDVEVRAISVYRSPEAPLDPFDGPRDYPPVLTLSVSADGTAYTEVCRIRMPALRSLDAPGVASFPATHGRFFRLQSSIPTWLIDVELHEGPRLRDWAGKANFAAQSEAQGGVAAVAPELCLNPAKVQDLSAHMDASGRFSWDAPPGRWTIVRLGHTTTGEVVGAAPEAGIGLECDKFSKTAVDLHFTRSLEPLFARLGPFTGSVLTAVSIDSWEAGKQNWTAGFPEFFQQARVYDLRPWVLAMTGRIVSSAAESDRFLFDLRRTQAELLAVNYYGHFRDRCHAYGLKLHAEPYGDGSFDSLGVAAQLDVTMGEFWARYTYGAKAYIDLAASANHTQGQPIVACEAFTGAPLTSRWTGHPYALKAEGDRMFSLGVNRFVFHTFVHQPHPSAKPGMTMGPFGTHFDRNTTWMDRDSGWIAYITRSQHVLQRGRPVAELCLLKGEEPMSGVPDPRTGSLAVPAGFAVDVLRASFVAQAAAEGGRLVLPCGTSYAAILLQPDGVYTAATLEALLRVVRGGVTLVTAGAPPHSPTLEGGRAGEEEFARLRSGLWPQEAASGVQSWSCGAGTVYQAGALPPVLQRLRMAPDFVYTSASGSADVVWTHRRFAGAEVYLVSNQRRRSEQLSVSFRVPHSWRPELWDAERGSREGVVTARRVGERTEVDLLLGPVESVFVVFLSGARDQPLPSARLLRAAAPEGAAPELPPSTDFSVTLWAEPETYALPGTSYLLYPDAGSYAYGQGHAVAGLAAGQNGIRVYERSKGAPKLVLESTLPISGWTHIALVYRAGAPSLFLDGELAGKASASGLTVHAPAVLTTVQLTRPVYFDGNATEPRVGEPLSPEEIRAEAAAGVPPPDLPRGATLQRSLKGRLSAIVWTSGSFRVAHDGTETLLRLNRAPAIETLTGAWTVAFPTRSGAPPVITLPALQPLNRHSDPGVRFFSGVACYRSTFRLHSEALAPGAALFLDLGRVNVIARVAVNGRECASVWKPPFRISICDVARAGENDLRIDVTTLWPNRLIGDEHLPAENEYAHSGPILRLPDWYREGKPKLGARVTFEVWHSYRACDPLLDSGLLGPVRLLHSMQIEL